MAAVKTTPKKTPNSKLKAGQKKSINKWLIVAGVAVVAVVGVLVVRYSGASGEVWSPRSKAVGTNGGVIKTKDNGYPYWVGGANNSIYMFTPSSGIYCVKGTFQSSNSKVTIFVSNTPNIGHFSGNKGQSLGTCMKMAKGAQYTLVVNAGAAVVNRFEKQ